MCNNANGITELNIFVDKEKNIFNCDGSKYIIPLYQRAFAWREKEICQLISDINDYDSNDNYYLGTLIVYKRNDGTFEVIDGQQRLTAFYILLNCLGFFSKTVETDTEKAPLTFECREKSNKTLLRLCSLERLNEDEFEHSIIEGKQIIEKELKSIDKDLFAEKLKKLIIFRIEVPPHTDLNRYFEVMNTRGEQLEQHDVVKAKLMEAIEEDKRDRFANIWEACSDMNGYVQMAFTPKLREHLFSGEWNESPKNIFVNTEEDPNRSVSSSDDTADSQQSIAGIIDNIKSNRTINISDDRETVAEEIRFESIIDFPHFLLHVLKVYTKKYCTQETLNLLGEQTDDKKLFDEFDSVIKHGAWNNGKKISEDISEFSEEFVRCLLLCRFAFDKYIIKREYSKNDNLGFWSLKQLEQSNKKPYYKATESQEEQVLMLQSCLRVSYISAKTMHWITDLLKYLYDKISANSEDFENYLDEINKVASTAIKDAFFDKDGKSLDTMGVNTQNIVFNYLDYLLWKEDGGKKYGDFVFEFRNSVEHWYPQNPSEGSFKKWDKVDRFGNLCLIQRQINSKFSNLSPEAKNTTYQEMIAKGSIKLRKMAEIIEDSNNDNWKNSECEKHEREMIEHLKKACGIK